jgi:integral membrane protein (TIGR01906 family)
MRSLNKLLSVIMSIAVALALLTGSIAAPILIRPFYYAQIQPLELESASGLSRDEIIQAYDEVLDYCIGTSDEFSAGVLPFSASGSAHFADCRVLFILDLWLFAGSVIVIVLLKLYDKRRRLPRLGRHGAPFWGAAGMAALLVLIGIAAATDFDRAFTVFHSLFFPGKDNWVFNAATDPVILIMPEAFFRNCAILILAVLLVISAVIIILDKRKGYAK